MFPKFKSVVESSFGLVVVVSFIIGFALPQLATTPDYVISLVIAALIFLACFRVEPTHLGEMHAGGLLAFYLIRYLVFPLLLLYAAGLVVPDIALAIFLLALMPAGVMSPALSAMFGGNAAVSLTLVLISSLLCPFVVPLMFYFFTAESVTIDAYSLFKSLAAVLFIPIILHLPFRNTEIVRPWIMRNNTFFTMLLLGVAVALVAARQRNILDMQFSLLAVQLGVLFLVFGAFYLLPWVFLEKRAVGTRIACTISSGANNNLLGIGLALLHFRPEVALCMVLTEIPWLLSLSLLERLNRPRISAA